MDLGTVLTCRLFGGGRVMSECGRSLVCLHEVWHELRSPSLAYATVSASVLCGGPLNILWQNPWMWEHTCSLVLFSGVSRQCQLLPIPPSQEEIEVVLWKLLSWILTDIPLMPGKKQWHFWWLLASRSHVRSFLWYICCQGQLTAERHGCSTIQHHTCFLVGNLSRDHDRVGCGNLVYSDMFVRTLCCKVTLLPTSTSSSPLSVDHGGAALLLDRLVCPAFSFTGCWDHCCPLLWPLDVAAASSHVS